MTVALTAGSVAKLQGTSARAPADQPTITLAVLSVHRYLVDPSYAPATNQSLIIFF